MHVVIVDEELPYPLTSGKRIRSFQLATRLAERRQVTYLCYRNRDEHEATQAEKAFRDRNLQVEFVPKRTPGQSVLARGPKLYARLAANLLSKSPYLVQLHNTPALRRCIEQYAHRHHVDLWHCEWTPYFDALSAVSAARPCVVMAHNVESLIWQRYCETERHPLKRWYIARQWRKFEHFERRVFDQAAELITVSEADAELARDRFAAPRVSVVDDGVDVSFFRPPAQQRNSRRILFLGSLDWRPNLDGVDYLLKQIWPRVLHNEPTAQLCIVGRKPPAWLRDQAAHVESVELHADVPDVRPFMDSCGAMVVPLRIGGGSRLKILEAAACELPVISTHIGAEGLHLDQEVHFVGANDAQPIADAITHSIRNPAAMVEMAQRARRVVLEKYDWTVLADKLDQVWRQSTLTNKDRQAA